MDNHLYGRLPINPELITPYNPPNQNSYLDDAFLAFTDSDDDPFIDSNT